jgi:predicted unusual protein kinase regulating ubiquinone biosynthesis (AarF/ABC1/UbiB family)
VPIDVPPPADRPRAHRPRRTWPIPKRQREAERFSASYVETLVRLGAWLLAIAHYVAHLLADRLQGRDVQALRGQRMRESFEWMGGTFLKLGQQVSTRLDLLPFPVCQELSKLLDSMPPFPASEAIAAIERTTGAPLERTFARFDPEPLGSMSICCIYRAFLHNGDEVVVKVRRPGIGLRLAADLAALDVLCRIAEALTLVRPGFTRALRTEFRTMLLEELDFQAEARFQELFRTQARRDGQPVTAPRVHYDLSGKEVLVSEYVRGVWLQDLVALQSRKDEAALQYLATLGITPKRVARRLLRTFYWSTLETLFYHADQHPGNVLILPGAKLVLTNFGACGPSSHRSRRNYRELFRRQARRDLDGIVQVFGNVLSPLPQTDVHGLLKAAEAKVARWQYGFDSKQPEWWERCSSGLWIGILEMAREHRLPVNIETVRFFRASLLCESTALRLYDRANGPKEFARYQEAANRRLRRRIVRRWQRETNAGQVLIHYDRVSDLAGRLMYRLEDYSDQPATSFLAALNKGSYVISHILRLGVLVVFTTAFGVAAVAGLGQLPGNGPTAGEAFQSVTRSPWYWSALVLLLLRSYRVVQQRLGDVD